MYFADLTCPNGAALASGFVFAFRRSSGGCRFLMPRGRKLENPASAGLIWLRLVFVRNCADARRALFRDASDSGFASFPPFSTAKTVLLISSLCYFRDGRVAQLPHCLLVANQRHRVDVTSERFTPLSRRCRSLSASSVHSIAKAAAARRRLRRGWPRSSRDPSDPMRARARPSKSARARTQA